MPFVVVDQRYCSPTPVELLMRDTRIFKDDLMEIMDCISGEPVFYLTPKVHGDSHRRVICGSDKKPIMSTSQEHWAIHETVYLSKGIDVTKADVDYIVLAKKSLLTSSHLDIWLKGNNNLTPDVHVSGDLHSRAFKITKADGTLLAEMKDAASKSTHVKNPHTYYVNIPAGVDMAFVMGVVTIVEEVFVEKLA